MEGPKLSPHNSLGLDILVQCSNVAVYVRLSVCLNTGVHDSLPYRQNMSGHATKG